MFFEFLIQKTYKQKIDKNIFIDSKINDNTNGWVEYNNLKELDLSQFSNIFDIGTHTGSFIVPATYYRNLIDNKCKIFAFEPLQENFKILTKNCKRFNRQVNLFNAAIYDRNGPIEFEIGMSTTTSRISEVNPFKISLDGKKRPLSKTKRNVEVNCLDILLFEKFIKDNCLMKLDCEGSEYQILNRLFSNNILPKSLIIELHPTANNKPEEYLIEIKNKYKTEIIEKKYKNGCIVALVNFLDYKK